MLTCQKGHLNPAIPVCPHGFNSMLTSQVRSSSRTDEKSQGRVSILLLSSAHGNECVLYLACKFYITYCISTHFFLWGERKESNQRKESNKQERSMNHGRALCCAHTSHPPWEKAGKGGGDEGMNEGKATQFS